MQKRLSRYGIALTICDLIDDELITKKMLFLSRATGKDFYNAKYNAKNAKIKLCNLYMDSLCVRVFGGLEIK